MFGCNIDPGNEKLVKTEAEDQEDDSYQMRSMAAMIWAKT